MKQFLFFLAIAVWSLPGCQQSKTSSSSDLAVKQLAKGSSVWVSFYNVENLFDPHDDPGKDDSEFLPESDLNWNSEKYVAKMDRLAQAVKAMNNGKGPDILGLAEVENYQTLEDWTSMTEMKTRGYEFIIEEGPDPRGIDCAFLYDPAVFVYKSHDAVRIPFDDEPGYVSRLLLQVDGELNGEPVSVIVVHWPSRRGGQEESEPRRVAAAQATKTMIEEIWAQSPSSGILVMGDFNDDPFNRSIAEVLKADTESIESPYEFLNPVGALHRPEDRGTLTYRGRWNLFDQILVSHNLLDEEGSLEYLEGSAGIHNPEFMQVGGSGSAKDMPRRAIYRGEFQDRGFSDHFPVYLRLSIR